MYKNYEKRVKEFISEMANPANQIIITDISEKNNSHHKKLLNDDKIPKPFVFKGYISEQDRINDTVKNHKILFNLPDYPDKKLIKSKSKEKESPLKINYHINEIENEKSKTLDISPQREATTTNITNSPKKYNYKRRMSITEKNQIKSLIKKDSILQPQMRFTARTDLERVYDALNNDYIKRNEREIIERQLKHINLFNYKKPKDLLKGDKIDNSFSEELSEDKKYDKSSKKAHKKNKNIKNIYGPSNVYYEARKNDKKAWARKDTLNLEARGLLSSYHFKTHFKATEEIAEYQSNNKTNAKESCFLLPHLLPKNYRYKILNLEPNVMNNNTNKSVKLSMPFDYSKIEETRDLFKFDEELEKTENEIKDREGEYNGINNPILMNNKLKVDPHSLKVLSKLAFKPKLIENEDLFLIDNNDINLLNNKEKPKDKNATEDTLSNLNIVAKKILNECNVYSHKSKFNNSSHKSKCGKTMITKGLTVKEFENKYKLNN